jgi:hypothetical protein
MNRQVGFRNIGKTRAAADEMKSPNFDVFGLMKLTSVPPMLVIVVPDLFVRLRPAMFRLTSFQAQ